MFKKMGEPCPGRILIFGTYMIHYRDRHYRGRFILVENYMQAIGQVVFGKLHLLCMCRDQQGTKSQQNRAFYFHNLFHFFCNTAKVSDSISALQKFWR
jgi:hypothetical protein